MPFGRIRSAGQALVILIVACVGLSINLQGWKSRIPTFDLIPHIRDAEALVRQHTLPVRGTLSSFSAYTPPGTTWLIAPGLLVTRDPRLFEYVGTSILYIGTLVGIFLVARSTFGTSAGYLAVALFGLSDVGGFFAGSLWPRGHPFFFVWMVYWLRRWVADRVTSALALAVVSWAAGMYVFMEIAPAALLVPALWFFYRPPLRLAPLTAALIASLCIWSPYLVYEQERDFQDLRALLTRRPVYASGAPGNYRQAWCNPNLPLRSVKSSALLGDEGDSRSDGTSEGLPRPSSFGSGLAQGGYRIVRWGQDLVANAVGGMAEGHGDAASIARQTILFLGSVCSLMALALTSTRLGALLRAHPAIRPAPWRTVLSALLVAVGMSSWLILPRLLSPDGSLEPATRDALRGMALELVFAGALLWRAENVHAALKRLANTMADGLIEARRGFLALALAVPWAGLLLTAEPGRDERFWWLLPLHAIVVAGLVIHVLERLGLSRLIRLGAATVFLISACGGRAGRKVGQSPLRKYAT